MGKTLINLGICAHADAGKTTLSEALLFQSGAIRTSGRVDHKDAFLDTHELEKERGITIFSKLARFETEVTAYDFQRGTMIGAPAIAVSPFGEGTVVVTSPHLEEDAAFYPYLRTLLLGAARERTCESKGALYCFPNE